FRSASRCIDSSRSRPTVRRCRTLIAGLRRSLHARRSRTTSARFRWCDVSKKLGRGLGLVGGLGPPATVHYYRELVAAHSARGYAARLLVAHADIDTATAAISAKDYAGLARYLASFIEGMTAGGADLTAMVAITAHICMPQLVPISPLPIIDMVEEVANALRSQGIKRIVLFGTRYTIETQMFDRLKDFDVVMPKPEEIELIHN